MYDDLFRRCFVSLTNRILELDLSWLVCWVCELSEECRVSVGIVSYMSLNSCSRHRVLALFILTLFISCSPSLYVAL